MDSNVDFGLGLDLCIFSYSLYTLLVLQWKSTHARFIIVHCKAYEAEVPLDRRADKAVFPSELRLPITTNNYQLIRIHNHNKYTRETKDNTATMAPTKQATINHMNADHQESLSLYLQAYCSVGAGAAKTAQLQELTLSDLLISTADGTRYTVPFTPPLKTLSEARARVVAMHREALTRLGLSDVKVTEYRLPLGRDGVALLTSLALYAFFSTRSHFEPGATGFVPSLLSEGARRVCYSVQPFVNPGIFITHVFEAAAFSVLRLKVHRVPLFSGVWWAWMGTTLLEGVFSWRRFADVVRDTRVRQEHSK